MALTKRQKQVIYLVAQSYCRKAIAAMLGVTVDTVEKHIEGIQKRLGASDVSFLTRFAIAHGMVPNKGKGPSKAVAKEFIAATPKGAKLPEKVGKKK